MSFFKAYDMRGTFGVDFDLETVRRIGRALPRVVPGKRWLVGRDCRETSDAVRDALVEGLVAAGVEVTDLGRCTTPMVYHFTAVGDFDGSVMVTASHNPPSDNGLKVSKRGALPVGYADGLDRVEALVREMEARGEPSVPLSAATARPADDLARRAEYAAWLRSRVPSVLSDAKLRIAVDCSNGMSSLLVREIFPEAAILNGTPDGRFPAHSPNPLQADAREEIARTVRERGLDCGVIFDGDADRAMVVDETGAFVQPDYLIPLVARATREAAGAAAGTRPVVLHDVRTSRGAIETLREEGFEPVMVPVGHAFAKPAMRARGALCGGELAGHYYFSEFANCDSGFLAAIRVLAAFAQFRRTNPGAGFSQMMRPIVTRYVNSGEVNFKTEDKDGAIARVKTLVARRFPSETGRSEMDGIRFEFADGWVNVRKSNTEPYLRLLAEFAGREVFEGRLAALRAAIRNDPLVLASASPRRAKILTAQGVAFAVVKTDAEEVPVRRDAAYDRAAVAALVTANVTAKLAAAREAGADASGGILAADTVVWSEDRILGKPRDLDEAAAFLTSLSGRTHSVFTAVGWMPPGATSPAQAKCEVCESRVTFRTLSAADVASYVAEVNPLDRAGAYDIDTSGERLVAAFEGEYENVMGLPVAPLRAWGIVD